MDPKAVRNRVPNHRKVGILAGPRSSRGVPGPSWGVPGLPESPRGRRGGVSGRLGGVCGRLGALMGLSGLVLGPSWARLGRRLTGSWKLLRPAWTFPGLPRAVPEADRSAIVEDVAKILKLYDFLRKTIIFAFPAVSWEDLRCSWEGVGSVLKPSWGALGGSKEHGGSIMGSLSPLRTRLGAVFAPRGRSRGRLGPSWARLGPRGLPSGGVAGVRPRGPVGIYM